MFTLPKKSYKIILLYNCDIELGEFQLFALKFFQFLYRLGGKNITINLSNDAKKYLSEKGYDKSYGARPLQRLIQKEIKEPISEEILFGKLKNGGTVNINLKNKKIIFLIKN